MKEKWIDTIGAWLLRIFACMMLFSWVVAFYPPYEKIWYDRTEPVTKEICEQTKEEYENSEDYFGTYSAMHFSGYPTEGMTISLKNYEHFRAMEDEPVCLEVDASKLEPTGVYVRVYDCSSMYTSSGASVSKYHNKGGTVVSSYHTAPKITTKAGAFLNRYRAIYAQYYVLSLEERDRVLILLNDTVVNIPKKGKVKLPYAAESIMRIDLEGQEISNLIIKHNLNYSGDYMYFLDASTYWFMFGLDEREFEDFRAGILVVMLVTGGLGLIILISYAVISTSKSKKVE